MSVSTSAFRLRKLPARYATIVMPFFLSILMTCIVSLVSTLKSMGLEAWAPHIWLVSWAFSWAVSFPVLLLVLPLVRRLTAWVVAAD